MINKTVELIDALWFKNIKGKLIDSSFSDFDLKWSRFRFGIILVDKWNNFCRRFANFDFCKTRVGINTFFILTSNSVGFCLIDLIKIFGDNNFVLPRGNTLILSLDKRYDPSIDITDAACNPSFSGSFGWGTNVTVASASGFCRNVNVIRQVCRSLRPSGNVGHIQR